MRRFDIIQRDQSSMKFIVDIREVKALRDQWHEDVWTYEDGGDRQSLDLQYDDFKFYAENEFSSSKLITKNYDPDGVQKFYEVTRALKLRPICKMKQMLLSDKIDLRFYGIDSKIVEAICQALENNTHVKHINLEHNLLSENACYHINELLLRNPIIISLNLKGCKIGPKGVEFLSDCIILNRTLQELNLSNCDIGDEGMNHLANALQENSSILTLDLSSNNLTYACASYLCSMLSFNYNIRKLNLSWNKLSSGNACQLIFKGLNENEFIKDIDLSWNGLGSDISKDFILQIYSFLTENKSLEILRLKNNRLTEGDAGNIGLALMKNNNLKELYLGGNPIGANGALNLIKMIANTPNSGIQLVELSHVWINKCKPMSFDIENNIIKRENFTEVIQFSESKFSKSELIKEILETIPQNMSNVSKDMKELYMKKMKAAFDKSMKKQEKLKKKKKKIN